MLESDHDGRQRLREQDGLGGQSEIRYGYDSPGIYAVGALQPNCAGREKSLRKSSFNYRASAKCQWTRSIAYRQPTARGPIIPGFPVTWAGELAGLALTFHRVSETRELGLDLLSS